LASKLQRLRQFLRGWAKNVSGNYKKEKAKLIKKADALEKKAEVPSLNTVEIDLKNYYKQRLVLVVLGLDL
jgi:hypothetical protein